MIRGARTRACRVETLLDASVSDSGFVPTGASVERSLDAARTSARATVDILAFCAAARLWAAGSDDVILQAMRAELNRARSLKFANLESPYYVEANVDDITGFTASATLGGLLSSNRSHSRTPRVQVRVGDYKFDNTNYVGSGFNYGSNYDVDRLPLEDNYDLLRRYLWLAIDRAYKSAVEAIARKRSLMTIGIAQLS